MQRKKTEITKLSKAQLDLLDSLISDKDGIHTDVIKESKELNHGETALYLEKAIKEDVDTFLISLDRLYNPELTGDAKTANIELIRSLKFINDICFNNKVKSEFGLKRALRYYFKNLGKKVIDHVEFQKAIRTRIQECIHSLSEAEVVDDSMIDYQQQYYICYIRNSKPLQPGWRIILDLPKAQLTEEQQEEADDSDEEISPGLSARQFMTSAGATALTMTSNMIYLTLPSESAEENLREIAHSINANVRVFDRYDPEQKTTTRITFISRNLQEVKFAPLGNLGIFNAPPTAAGNTNTNPPAPASQPPSSSPTSQSRPPQ